MTFDEAQIIIGNIPIKPEVLDGCYSILEYQEAKTMAIKAIELLEQPRWIPVSERLPEDNTRVLVTVKVGNRDPKVRSGNYKQAISKEIDIVDFAEEFLGIKLFYFQKQILKHLQKHPKCTNKNASFIKFTNGTIGSKSFL